MSSHHDFILLINENKISEYYKTLMSTKKTCYKNTVSKIYNLSLNLYTSWWTFIWSLECDTTSAFRRRFKKTNKNVEN